jgi:hypothetical protein
MKKLLFLFGISCFLFACKNSDSSSQNAENTNVSPTNNEDLVEFYEFYNNFHSDTAFQMAHISFPLAGKPTHGMNSEESGKFYWQQENWALHRPIDFETSPFKRRILPLGDDLIMEYITHEKMSAGMMRRFAKLGDEWYLIYYEGMQTLLGEQ